MSNTWSLPVAASAAISTARQAWNDGLAALRSLHSGTTAPPSTEAGMLWLDTNADWVKQRNEADTDWVNLFKSGDVPGAGLVHRAAGWLTSSSTTLTLPQIPANHVVLRAGMQVTEAFDSSGTDLARSGDATDDDRYTTDVDVSTTGLKSLAAGADLGLYSSVVRTPQFKYAPGGSAATTGKALCWLEYILVAVQP